MSPQMAVLACRTSRRHSARRAVFGASLWPCTRRMSRLVTKPGFGVLEQPSAWAASRTQSSAALRHVRGPAQERRANETMAARAQRREMPAAAARTLSPVASFRARRHDETTQPAGRPQANRISARKWLPDWPPKPRTVRADSEIAADKLTAHARQCGIDIRLISQ